MNTNLIKENKHFLESINVCQRCILRFLGIKEYKSYATKSSISNAFQELMVTQNKNVGNGVAENSNESLDDDCDGYPPPKRLSSAPCISCLGILQHSCDDMLPKVQLSVNESGHIFNDFVLQLSIPVAVDLRDQLILLHLKEKFSDSYNVAESEIPSVKDVWKWVVGSQFGEITHSNFTPYSDFQISISVTYPDCAKECLPLSEKYSEAFPNKRKRKATLDEIYNRTAVMKAIEHLSSDLKNLYEFPPSIPDNSCVYKIQCQHSPIYIGGRYNKYSRELPQTPWVVGGERRMESSVNELITDIVQKHINCDKIIFSASGREDVDVRMLGNGRPFVLEIINPRKVRWSNEEMKRIENEINETTKLISVNKLQMITKEDTLLLKEGEEQKRKSYSALCIVGKALTENDINKLNNLTDITLNQDTPIRVLHRRTLATRERILHSMKAQIVNDNQLRIHLETQAGTYVKEFVHGDFGRTIPSLGTLLDTPADILELDVESIELEWPPQPS